MFSVVIEQDQLQKALRAASHVARGSSPQIPILRNVLLQASDAGLSVSATDLDMWIETKAPAEVAEPGEVTVSADRLLRLVSAFESGGEINIKAEENVILVKSGRSRIRLPSLPTDGWPAVVPEKETKTVNIPAGSLRNAIAFCRDAICDTEDRPHFMGIRFEAISGAVTALAYDGTNLANAPLVIDGAGDFDITVPTRAIDIIAGFLPKAAEEMVTATFGERLLALAAGRQVVTTKLVESEWPNWRSLLQPQTEYEIKVNINRLMAALERMSVATERAPVFVRANDDGLLLFARGGDKALGAQAREEVEARVIGAMTGGLLAPQMLAALSAVKGVNPDAADVEWLGFAEDKRPMRIRPPGSLHWLRLSMPCVAPAPEIGEAV